MNFRQHGKDMQNICPKMASIFFQKRQVRRYSRQKKETIYLDSHFGNASYFTNYNVWLNEDFVNPLCIRDNNISFYQTILNTESVCVTIRRGDFFYQKIIKIRFSSVGIVTLPRE